MFRSFNLIKLMITFSLIFFLTGCQSPPKIEGIPVNFQRVISGNLIEILWTKGGNTTVEKVRLMGIKAPELKQKPWGNFAQKKLEQLLTSNPQSLNLRLQLEQEKPDQYGNFWGFIWYENQLINQQIVKEGWAIVEPCSPILPKNVTSINLKDQYCDRLLNSQQYARLMELGIWQQKAPFRETL